MSTNANKEILELLETLKSENSKKRMMTAGILWGTTSILVILKALGLSQISWFWTTFILLLPVYMMGAFLAVCILVMIGAFCVLGIIEGIDSYERYKKSKKSKANKGE